MARRAAGLVVYRLVQDRPEFLLLQASNGGWWSPPKGHVDQLPGGDWEEDLTAALRETEEEAGIGSSRLHIHTEAKGELRYEAWGSQKVVTYWLAKLLQPEPEVVLSDEHQDFKWAECEAAIKLADFPDLQSLLQEFHETVVKGRGQ
jgi:bis(5'-nucleosidyl)-tetraphosphatase